MKKFTSITSNIAVLNIENIDTDQIIGSDHLKITNKGGLGKHLFSAWRYLSNGQSMGKAPRSLFSINRKLTMLRC